MLAQAVGIQEIIVVLAYLLVVGYLGWLGYRQTKSAADYLVAGRQVHPYIMALSYGATFISTSAIVGFGGVAGMFGMSVLWLTFLNIFVGIFIAFVFLGGPTRKLGHRLGAHTFPELLGNRYQSTFIQVFAGLIIFLFIPLYASAVLIGGCEFIATKFDMSYDTALLVFSAIIAVYVTMGGLKGVMYTDALQGSIMFIGMLFLLIWTYSTLGGMTEAHQQLTEIGKQPSIFGGIGFKGWTSMPQFGWGVAESAKGPNPVGYNLWWIVVSTITLGVGIGVLAQPQLAVRFMTVKSKRELNRAVLVGGVFILVMTGVAFTVGSLSNLFFYKHETIHGSIVKVTEGAMVIAKKERGIKTTPEGDIDEAAVPCNLIHIVTDDNHLEIDLVAEGIGPVVPIMPHATIIDKKTGEEVSFADLVADKANLENRSFTINPNATAFTRSLVKKGDKWAFNPDSIIPTFITSAMPSWFGLLFLLTLLAAAMSTLSSQFHALGTSIGRDVYEKLSGSEGKGIGVTRIGIILGIIIAVIISHYARGGYFIARATAIFFGLCGSAFLPAFIGGLFSKKVTKAGAICSMVTGFVVTAFWLLFVKDKEARAMGVCKAMLDKYSLFMDGNTQTSTLAVVDPIIVALPLSLLVLIIVSMITKKPDNEHISTCFND